MTYVFLTALAISVLDLFMSSWKAMAIGASALALLYIYAALQTVSVRVVPTEPRRERTDIHL
jgi:hypothetical protein